MKVIRNPFIRRAFLASTLTAFISVQTAYAVDLTWDNSASTGKWNTTEANWTGSTWSNANPDNAVFNNRNETVTLTEAISAGSLSFLAGGWQSGNHLLTLTGSPLSLASITVNGQNGGNVDSLANANDQRLKLENISVTASGDVSVARGSMEVSGTTALNITGITGKLLATGDWSNFVMGAGTSVTATGGVDFYNSLTATNLDLNGGTLTTAYIYGNSHSGATVNFNGTTVVATADNADFLQVHQSGSAGIRTSAAIRTGGLIFDTVGHAVTIANVLANYSGETGTLTKTGTGTLTLSSANTYTGTTTINDGKLLIQDGIGNASNQFIDNANLEFNLSGTNAATLNANGGSITGTGNLIKSGTGTLTISGAFGKPQTVSLTGASSLIDVQGGTLQLWDGENTGWENNEAALSVASGATFYVAGGCVGFVDAISGNGTIRGGGGYSSNPGSLTIGCNDGSGTFSGTLQNDWTPLQITKTGTGTQTFSGVTYNNYGAITVNGGKLLIQDGIGNTSNQFIANANLEFNLSGTNAVTLNANGGSITGTGNLIKSGTGTLTISGAFGKPQTVSLTGASSLIDVQGGTLQLWDGENTGWENNKAALNVASGATFYIAGGCVGFVDVISGNGTIRGGGGYSSNPGSLTIGCNDGSGTFSGTLQNDWTPLQITKTGTGTQILSGTNTYTGDTTVSAGTLALTGGSETSPITVSDGAFIAFTPEATITSTGNLTLDSGAKVKITALPGAGSYTLFTTSGSINGTPVLDTTVSGYILSLTVNGGNTLILNAEAAGGYDSWKGDNAGGETPDLDWDNDGVANGVEYFMNAAAGFTATPALGAGNTITWTNGGNIPSSDYGTQYVVQTSGDLETWIDVDAGDLTTNTSGPGGSLTYTLTGSGKRFVRLKVTPTP